MYMSSFHIDTCNKVMFQIKNNKSYIFFIPFISKYIFIWLKFKWDGMNIVAFISKFPCKTWNMYLYINLWWIKTNLLCLHIIFVDLFTADALFAIVTFLLVKIKLTAHMGVRSTRVGDGVWCKRQNVSHDISLGSRVWKKKSSQ